MNARRVRVLGMGIDLVDRRTARDRFLEWLNRPGSTPAHVVTANPELVVRAQREPHLARTVERADLVVADGVGLVWAAAVLGERLPARLPGIDLIDAFLEDLAGRGGAVYLLGGRPGVAERAGRRLIERHPGLRLAGCSHGYFSGEDEAAVLAKLRAASPELLLAGLGMPKQELWISRNRETLPVRVAVGVGGAFDIWSGRLRRAPAWMRTVGLEWAFRLAQEPRRVRRMLALPAFIGRVVRERFR